ncbi:MAG: D-alanyl-D-alanine carboxypeptidase [Ruminococcaceae bacterium]|nr:D-alanyl-D-alanine carboxypeptidase [Oscillospiraceae bacterium]
MKRYLCMVLCMALVLTGMPEVSAEGLGLSAKSAVVMDAMTGRVIYEKNAHAVLPMASTTKIMTALCAIEQGNPDDMVKVHPSAVGVEGSSMYLGHGETLTLRDLLYGLMLASGNDAAVAIAMHISGGILEFADLMNRTAQKIGATQTSFRNPNGLDAEGHHTTAYDLARITRYAMKYELFRTIVSSRTAKMPWAGHDYPRVLNNHNKLLKMYDGADGVKTGYTKKDGRCLVSSATRNGFQVIAVTLNAPNDWDDHAKMLDFAFDQYTAKPLVKAGDYLRTVMVKRGMGSSVQVHAGGDLTIPVPKGEAPDVQVLYHIPDVVDAPVGFEAVLGRVEAVYDNEVIASVDAVAAGAVAEREIPRLWMSLRMILRDWLTMYANQGRIFK